MKVSAALISVVAISVAIAWSFGRRSDSPEQVDLVTTKALKVRNVTGLMEEGRDKGPGGEKIAATESSPSTEMKVRTLNEVLTSHNDNDPRLDGELRILDRDTKRAFRARYEKIPVEERNARGTIVFLLGRNLAEKEDFAFVRQVLREEPCRSLENCAKVPLRVNPEDPPNEMVLNYPQAVALVALGNVIRSGESPPHVRSETIAAIREGAKSSSPKIAKLSNELLNRLTR